MGAVEEPKEGAALAPTRCTLLTTPTVSPVGGKPQITPRAGAS